MKTHPHSIERLESRIAPATLLPDGKTLTYQDVDGDDVTVKLSKPLPDGLNPDAVFNFNTGDASGSTGPQQLEAVHLALAGLKGVSLTATAEINDTNGGNGLVHIGFINGGVGVFIAAIDLGTIKIEGDLGRVVAGDSDPKTAGLKLLDVMSMGTLALNTQGGSGDLNTEITGSLGTLKVKNSIVGATVHTTGKLGHATLGGSLAAAAGGAGGLLHSDGDMGPVKIGGSLQGAVGSFSGAIWSGAEISSVSVTGGVFGGTGVNSGGIFGHVSVGAVTIHGDLEGMSTETGRVWSNGTIGKVTVDGSLKGGMGDDSGQIFGHGTKATVIEIGTNVIGGGGEDSGEVSVSGDAGSVTVGGSVTGNSGNYSGAIDVNGSLGSLTIGGSVTGLGGSYSGALNVNGDLGSLKIGGSLKGGSELYSGGFNASGNVGSVKITGSVTGGSKSYAGQISASGNIGSVKIDGDLIGGGDAHSGGISAGNLGSVTIGMNVQAGSGAGGRAIDVSDHLGKLTVGGSLMSSATQPLVISAETIGTIKIKGSIDGSVDKRVYIVASGRTNPASNGAAMAIKSVTVEGEKMEFGGIFAGWSGNLQASNADAQIGTVNVVGNWIASNLVAGAENTGIATFGDSSDKLIDGGDPEIISKIAKVVIGGTVSGTSPAVNPNDHYGFVAEKIGSFKAGGATIALDPNAKDNKDVGTTGDVSIHEV